VVEDGFREEPLAVGHQPHRRVEVGDEGCVVVEVCLLGSHLGVLDVVELRPEPLAVDAPRLEQGVPRAVQAVPHEFGFAVGERPAQPVADLVEHGAGVRPLRVDEGPVEVEQPVVVVVGDHGAPE
jgi:hypothetical protein